MPSRESTARHGPRKPIGLPDRAPTAWSVALHAALLAAAAFVPWSQRHSTSPPRMEVVWVREWPPAQNPRPPAEPKNQDLQPQAEEQAPARAQTQPRESQADELRAKEPPAQAPRPEELRPTRPASNAPSTGHAPTPRRANIDWDAERRVAIQQLSRDLERENRFPTFSFNDIVPKTPPEDADPLEHLFDGGGGGPSAGRSVLGVGQARTKVGRFLSDLCNALTGGVSVFGVMSLCARGTEEPYSASPLRPEYLKKLPVCEDTAPLGTNADSSHASRSAITTIKCRLLTDAERAEYWKNAAERLRREELVTAPEQDAAR